MTLLNAESTFNAATMVPWLVGLVIILVFIAIYTVNNAKVAMDSAHGTKDPAMPNYGFVLLQMLVGAGVVVYLLKVGLEAQWGMLNTLVFGAAPYVALAIFIIGSIYRYLNRGFQVSSLSSEFLERKKLFWGSQPFHWGLMFLIGGHLIAFLIPSAVMAWNAHPLRLLVLEVSSFAFGLSALLGLLLLIKRRLGNKRLLIVANKMDMLVYVILISQILSGLGVAYYVRWGSSWFAAVITPYLRSIFALNPDISAVSAMPWLVHIHIFSAFVLIAIIPFTRFMHFLVAPIDYIWRGYQLVIWNWNRRSIRKPGSYYPGVKTKNN